MTPSPAQAPNASSVADPKHPDTLKLIHPNSKNTQLIKVFRELRTHIYTKIPSKNFVCLVTAVAEQGGASFIAKNLASVIALDKTKSAVLVDCNLYAPSIDELFLSPPDAGLTDWLDRDDVSTQSIIHDTILERMYAISVGNNCDGGTEKINSNKMRDLINELKASDEDRFVILDAPSIKDYGAEIRILADLADFTVLVVPNDSVTEADIEEAKSLIGEGNIAAHVLNNTHF